MAVRIRARRHDLQEEIVRGNVRLRRLELPRDGLLRHPGRHGPALGGWRVSCEGEPVPHTRGRPRELRRGRNRRGSSLWLNIDHTSLIHRWITSQNAYGSPYSSPLEPSSRTSSRRTLSTARIIKMLLATMLITMGVAMAWRCATCKDWGESQPPDPPMIRCPSCGRNTYPNLGVNCPAGDAWAVAGLLSKSFSYRIAKEISYAHQGSSRS